MFSRIHDRLGTAGLIIAVIALIAALAGTAFAAAGLNGKQKKEVTNIAKKYAGKKGPKGDTGPTGAAGPKGDAGVPGKEGPEGPEGKEGKEGKEGEIGPEGSPWVAGTAPSGVVMKGTWVLPPATAAAAAEDFFVPVSTSVPINQKNPEGEPLTIFFSPPFCEGTAENPQPPSLSGNVLSGAVCIYTKESTNIGVPLLAGSQLKESGGGAVVLFKSTGAGTVSGYGSWAMGTP